MNLLCRKYSDFMKEIKRASLSVSMVDGSKTMIRFLLEGYTRFEHLIPNEIRLDEVFKIKDLKCTGTAELFDVNFHCGYHVEITYVTYLKCIRGNKYEFNNKRYE